MPRLFVPAKARSSMGFTVLEIIVVLVLLGILAAVAISRVSHGNDAEIRAAADRLKVHLRHAQGRAMNSDIPWGVHFSGNNYWLFFAGNINNRMQFLGEGDSVVALPLAVTPVTVSFDDWGMPYLVADPRLATAIPEDADIVISIGSAAITITAETGFIP